MASLAERMLLGALAGFAATLPMTVAMRRLHERLPSGERYPLPPRELAEDLPSFGFSRPAASLLHHFLFGALGGAAFGAVAGSRKPVTGATFGVGVWAASYFGWIPAMGLLRFAASHPARRNGLMIAVHLVWGATLALGLRELEAAQTSAFSRAGGENSALLDRQEDQG
jgi:hypothetical protein